MFSVEEKFPAIFDENDDLNYAGQQLTTVASPLPNKYDFKKGDVVLMTLPETDDLWIDLIEACIAQKVYVIIPAHNRDAAFIAQTIRENEVSVLAISPGLWPGVFDALNARPEAINRMQVIISDGQGSIETRFSLIPGMLSIVNDARNAYQLVWS
jgi:hypothetical protein